jgi:hypothetical protein
VKIRLKQLWSIIPSISTKRTITYRISPSLTESKKNKAYRHNITEILLKVALMIITISVIYIFLIY